MKKIPIWAIYLADIMCVISALLIAGTYFYAGLPMETIVVLLCAFMVFSATAIICTAQILHFKYTKLAKEKTGTTLSANIEENFQILFKQVSAIKRDNSTLNANFTSLLNRYNALDKTADTSIDTNKILGEIDSIRAKIEEFENKFAKDEDIAKLKLDLDDSFENLRADVELDLGRLEDIDNAVKDLKSIIEDISKNAEEFEESEILDEPKEILETKESPNEESASEKFLRQAQERLRQAQANIEEEELVDDEEELERDGVDTSNRLSQMSLMSRALNNTQQSHSILGRFAKVDALCQEENDDDVSDEDDFEDDIEDIDDDLADIMNIGNEQETVLIVNAILGLGNKPYIRGFAQGLSESEGVQMELIGIGKWRYIFKDLREGTKFSIWLNDEEVSEEGEIYIEAGESLEIDVNFS